MTDKNNRNIGGRPRLSATEKRKYLLPPVRLNTTEYFSVKGLARQAGVSLTEYQRQCILNGRVVERLRPEHLDLYRQLVVWATTRTSSLTRPTPTATTGTQSCTMRMPCM